MTVLTLQALKTHRCMPEVEVDGEQPMMVHAAAGQRGIIGDHFIAAENFSEERHAGWRAVTVKHPDGTEGHGWIGPSNPLFDRSVRR